MGHRPTFRTGEVVPGGPAPSLAKAVAEISRRLARNQGLDVVERTVGVPGGTHAAGPQVRGPGVPAPTTEVDAADEGHPVVHHHDLFVVRSSDGVLAVKMEMKALVGVTAHFLARPGLPFENVDHGPVPAQDMDMEIGPVEEPPKERSKGLAPSSPAGPPGARGECRCRPPSRG